MRLSSKLKETNEEKNDRIKLIDKNIKKFILKNIPTLFVILAFAIFITIVINNNEKEVNIGNPYECEDCKQFNRACKKHKNFDSKKSLENKVYKIVDNYKYLVEYGESMFVYKLYDYNYYNTQCDFCKQYEEECEGCRYNREAVVNYIDKILNNDEYHNKFNIETLEKGYPENNSDISFIVSEVLNLINK